MTKWGCLVAIALLVAGCGGGGGGGPVAPGLPPPVDEPGLSPLLSDLLLSDLLFSGSGYTDERVNVECAADRSSCRYTFRGISRSFSPDPNPADTVDPTNLGDWAHMAPVVVKVAAEGLEGRMALISGTSATSLPVALGSATWEGSMVALDSNHELVRGGATLTIADLATPAVDVALTPDGHDAMIWDALPVTRGRFSARAGAGNYLRGAFYGPEAQEAGGVFERNQLLGAFGATR